MPGTQAIRSVFARRRGAAIGAVLALAVMAPPAPAQAEILLARGQQWCWMDNSCSRPRPANAHLTACLPDGENMHCRITVQATPAQTLALGLRFAGASGSARGSASSRFGNCGGNDGYLSSRQFSGGQAEIIFGSFQTRVTESRPQCGEVFITHCRDAGGPRACTSLFQGTEIKIEFR